MEKYTKSQHQQSNSINEQKRRAATNSTFASGGVTCPADSFLVKESVVLRMNIYAKKPARTPNCKTLHDILGRKIQKNRNLAKSIQYDQSKTIYKKWVGGKNQLLQQFEAYYHNELRKGIIKNYVEPFLGGGALFFALSQRYKLESAYLSDLNKDLILTYQVI